MPPSTYVVALVALTAFVAADAAVTSAIGSSAVKDFVNNCISAAIPGFSYNPAGSGAGASAVGAGSVGVSDISIGVDSNSVECPFVSGNIGVIVNGVAGVKLDPCLLAGIYDRTITSWDDPAIAAKNPGSGFSGPIVPIGRSDPSGSTNLFSQYVASCGTFSLGVGRTLAWKAGTLTASGTDGVIGLIASTPGGITYASRGGPQALLKGKDADFFDSTSGSAPIKFTAVVAAQKSVDGLKEFLETVYSGGVVGCAGGAGFIPLNDEQLGEGAACIASL